MNFVYIKTGIQNDDRGWTEMKNGRTGFVWGICLIGCFLVLILAAMLQTGAQAQVPDQETVRQLLEQRQRLQGQQGNSPSPVDLARQRSQGQTGTDRTLPKEGKELENGKPLSALEFDYNVRLGRSVEDIEKAERRQTKGDEQDLDSLQDPQTIQALQARRARKEAEIVRREELGARLGQPGLLRQYGYDLFQGTQMAPQGVVTGRLPDRYILGVGDELVITLTGSVRRTVTTSVDREGRVVLSDLPPINAAGRPFGAFEAELKQQVAQTLLGTDVFVSVGSLRQIMVTVVGEVAQPGYFNITSQTDLLQLLSRAGGVLKTGSLRRIMLVSGGETRTVDLYDVLNGAPGVDLSLRDGDRLFVPLIGDTFAVGGAVMRPGIYELAVEQGPLVGDGLALAGGAIRPRGYRVERNRISPNGRQEIGTASLDSQIMAGDVYRVAAQKQIKVGQVGLEGYVYQSGKRALDDFPTLSSLLAHGDALKPGPYTLFAVLETTDSQSHQKVLRPVNLGPILAGMEDVVLKDQDTLFILGPEEQSYLTSEEVRNAILFPEVVSAGQCKAVDFLRRLARQADGERLSAAARSVFVVRGEDEKDRPGTKSLVSGGNAGGPSLGVLTDEEVTRQAGREIECNRFFETRPEFLPFAIEYAVVVMGAIRQVGMFPVAEVASLRDLVASAGGLSLSADPRQIEISSFRSGNLAALGVAERKYIDLNNTSLSDVSVLPGSTVRFAPQKSALEAGTVLLSGEFNRPGVYSISKGETILDVIERAGGLSDQAYPFGAVFTRVSVKQEQQEGFRRTARELNNALALAMLKQNVSGEALTAASGLVNSFASVEAAGRVVVEADPVMLRQSPERNLALEGGDAIFMPKRPNFVLMAGDVLNPGALQFRPGKTVEDYLAETGGFQETADKGRVFIVFPNGVAEPVSLSRWSRNSIMVPPGSTIVVPKDVNPLETLNIVREITQVLSNLAVSAASVAVISR